MSAQRRLLRLLLVLPVALLLTHPPLITAWTSLSSPLLSYGLVFLIWAGIIVFLAWDSKSARPKKPLE